MSIKINLPAIEAGVRYQHSFRWSVRDADGIVTPVDLTAWSALLQIRKKAGDAVVLMSFGTEAGTITLTGNTVAMDIGGTATKDATWTVEAEYDLILWPTTDADQAVRLTSGTVAAVKLVTQLPTGP